METLENQEKLEKKAKPNFADSKYATGRIKKSIASVWLKKGSGDMLINGKKLVEYFINPNLQTAVIRPLKGVKGENEFDVMANVTGGGLSGQAGAIMHGISRALVEFEPTLKPT